MSFAFVRAGVLLLSSAISAGAVLLREATSKWQILFREANPNDSEYLAPHASGSAAASGA